MIGAINIALLYTVGTLYSVLLAMSAPERTESSHELGFIRTVITTSMDSARPEALLAATK